MFKYLSKFAALSYIVNVHVILYSIIVNEFDAEFIMRSHKIRSHKIRSHKQQQVLYMTYFCRY